MKSVTPVGIVDAGATLHYSIGTCNGPSAGPATGVIVTDLIPAGAAYMAGSMLLTGAPLSDLADGDEGTLIVGPPDSLSFAIGDLVAGQCVTVEFDVRIDAAATGTITNTARFAADGVAAVDTNSVSTPIRVITTPPDLSATKSSTVVGGAPALVGSIISYTVEVCNAAAAGPATDVTIADAIPLDALTGCGGAFVPGSIKVDGVAQTDAADADLVRFDAAPAPGGIVALIPTIAPGRCVTLTFNVTVIAACDNAERVNNVATAASPGLPSLTTNQTSDAVSTGGGGIEACSGGLDEDGDGDIDCADADCATDPGCLGLPPTLMRKVGLPLVNRCTAWPGPCGCEVGNRLDPVADDCITAGTCIQVDAVTWTLSGELQVRAALVFYEVDRAGCVAAGDSNHLVVRKSLPNSITIQLVP